jgi:pimeloyl-ACP methyl ester carboxylesterase
MWTEDLTFTGGGGASLAATLYHPDSAVLGSVLMAHCFTCSQELHTTTRLARALSRGGYLVMTFDFTGLGRSRGDFARTSVTTNVADLTRASVALIERDQGPCILIGHSLGGAAALLAARRIHRLKAVVTIGTPASLNHIRSLIETGLPPDDESGDRLVSVGGRRFRIGSGFLADLEEHDPSVAAAELDIPLLVVAAGSDGVVPQTDSEALAATGGADFAVIEGADHLFSDRDHSAELALVVLDWLGSRV